MFTKRLALWGILFTLLFTSACGSAAEPAVVTREVVVTKEVEAIYTEAPATEAAAWWFGDTTIPNSNSNPAPTSKANEPYDMFFKDYGVNPSIDAEDDNLSTFALDVDTGSYTIMRNYLNEGNLPPSESVRVEEYVNYFEQDYPVPPEHQAFAISVDGAPSPFTLTERYQMIRVGIQGYEVPDRDRKSANLVFVVDTSGSMGMDNRLALVRWSLETLVDQLYRDDTVTIVAYGTDAAVILEPTRGSDKETIYRAIGWLQPGGVTNAEAGIRLGYKMAMRAFIPGGINRIILCSDGVANTGETEWQALLDEVSGYVEEGVTMSSFGFGLDNYNDVLMEQLADNGDGMYAYIDDRDEARNQFIDNLTSNLQTIAMDAKVQVEFNPEVVMRYRLVGFENRAVADEDFRDNKVDAGEIGAGHSVTALYEVKLHPEAFGQIATVYLRWEDPDTRQVTELSKDFSTEEMAREFEDASPTFQRAVVVAEYAEILKESYWAEDSTLRDVYREAERIAELFFRDDAMQEFVELVRQAMRLRE